MSLFIVTTFVTVSTTHTVSTLVAVHLSRLCSSVANFASCALAPGPTNLAPGASPSVSSSGEGVGMSFAIASAVSSPARGGTTTANRFKKAQ